MVSILNSNNIPSGKVLFLFFLCMTMEMLNSQQIILGPASPEDSLLTNKKDLKYYLQINPNDSLNIFQIDDLFKVVDSLNRIREFGIPSPIYGHHLFQNTKNVVLSTNDVVRVPDSYVLGTGDEITVSIFGNATFDAKFLVQDGGFIQPSNMPKIFLKGVTWGQAQEMLRRRFQQFYIFRDEQAAFSVSKPRSVVVHIFGEVKNPGSYTISAINTVFNALVAAGGLSKTGSVRNIMISNGGDKKVLDLYSLISDPSAQFDYYLTDHSIIQIPAVGKLVDITGSVRISGTFELTAGESFSDLLRYAGGLKGDAAKEFASLKRYSDNRQELIDIELKPILNGTSDEELMNGDEIYVSTISDRLYNAVKVEGAVQKPGDYSLVATPDIRSLLSKSQLTPDARMDLAFLIRTEKDSTIRVLELNLTKALEIPNDLDNIRLEDGDRLVVNKQSRYNENARIFVEGAVRDSILELWISPESGINIYQAILLAGGLTPEASGEGYILRSDYNNPKKKTYLQIDLAAAMKDRNGPLNLQLQPLDRLIVLSNDDYSDLSHVTSSGAFRSPCKLEYDKSLSLLDAIKLSGGLKPEASGLIDIYRLSLQNDRSSQIRQLNIDLNTMDATSIELEPYDKLVARTIAEFELQQTVQIQGQVMQAGEYVLTSDNERVSELIRKAGGVSTDAFLEAATIWRDYSYTLSIRLDKILASPGSIEDIILEDGDIVKVPKRNNEVQILLDNTALTNFYIGDSSIHKIAVPYVPGKNALWYLKNYAGGLTHKSEITVMYANGTSKGTGRFLFFKKYPAIGPGSTIKVNSMKEADLSNTENSSSYPKFRKGVVVNVLPPESGSNQNTPKPE